MRSVRLEISGMSCSHCVARVSKTLGSLGGLEVDSVRIGAAELRLDPSRRSVEDVVQALHDAGYEATVAA